MNTKKRLNYVCLQNGCAYASTQDTENVTGPGMTRFLDYATIPGGLPAPELHGPAE
jgi:hypothetical protein